MKINLENNRFRFKTEEEMISDFGENWREEIRFGWLHEMDWFIGRTIPKKHHLECFKTYIGIQDYFIMIRDDCDWCIGQHMIKSINNLK